MKKSGAEIRRLQQKASETLAKRKDKAVPVFDSLQHGSEEPEEAFTKPRAGFAPKFGWGTCREQAVTEASRSGSPERLAQGTRPGLRKFVLRFMPHFRFVGLPC